MTYVLVENGEVVQKQSYAQEGFIDAPDYVTCGWTYDGETFEPPVIVEPPLALPPLTRKKLRKALLEITVTAADVEAYIAAMPDPIAREDAMIDWQDSDEYHRSHPLIDLVASALQLPAEQVDTLWAWAAVTDN